MKLTVENEEHCQTCKDSGMKITGEWCECEKGLNYNFLWFTNRLNGDQKIIEYLKGIKHEA